MSGDQELKAMIEQASETAAEIFNRTGSITGIYQMVTDTGDVLFTPKPMPDDKSLSAALMRVVFQVKRVVRYVHVDEAWFLEPKPGDPDAVEWIEKHGDLSMHPSRQEAIMFSAEDHDRQLFARRVITRDGDKATLGPLIFDTTTEAEGRSVGMLQPTGRTMQ